MLQRNQNEANKKRKKANGFVDFVICTPRKSEERKMIISGPKGARASGRDRGDDARTANETLEVKRIPSCAIISWAKEEEGGAEDGAE